ncbi:hypothetical protein C2G38_2152208 [Gigaspora rosea]|uniref:Uncharacterized protein n=1 Tax=Gigaspora rosea TaxID=44941 RepID=A0A397WAI8_9GLOM|nr:hypothetical protein C2G38_2152208 [Gigaspora rosea]
MTYKNEKETDVLIAEIMDIILELVLILTKIEYYMKVNCKALQICLLISINNYLPLALYLIKARFAIGLCMYSYEQFLGKNQWLELVLGFRDTVDGFSMHCP